MEADRARIIDHVSALYWDALTVGFLIDDGTLKMQLAAADLENQIALRIHLGLVCAFDFELNVSRVDSRRHGKVVFQLLVVAVVDQIDSRINVLEANLSVSWNVSVPLRRVVSEKVIDLSRLLFFSHGHRILVRTRKLELQSRGRLLSRWRVVTLGVIDNLGGAQRKHHPPRS